jgi:hypothetical protein
MFAPKFFIVACLVLVFACKGKENEKQETLAEIATKQIYADSLLDISFEPCVRFGKIHNKVAETDLINLYGKTNVQTYRDTVGGKPYATTILFEGQNNELQIVWHNEELLQYPNVCLFTKNKTKWQAPEGITIGTSLEEITKINGKPFEFTGFGSPNGGIITDFKGGKLQAIAKCYVFVLDYDRKSNPIIEAPMSGSEAVGSDNPKLKSLGLKIKNIRVFLNKKPTD